MPLSDDLSWWEQFRASDGYRRLQSRPIVYFCAEFALNSNLKTYSGGLGVLAGDIVREAADQKLPMVGVGLLYDQAIESLKIDTLDALDLEFLKSGNLDQDIKTSKHQDQEYQKLPSSRNPALEPILAAGAPLTVRVPIQDRYVTVAAFRYPSVKLGTGWWSGGVRTAPVYLLTTDCPGSDPRDCCITDKLYPADKEKRLQQEIILGLGGLRLLEALAIHPSIYHLNEGHSAFLTLEIIRHEMSERLIGFDDALNLARRHVVFTNHTLVAAGHDVYSDDLVAANLAKYAEELAIPVDRLVSLGLVQESSLFSMTMLSLRLSGKTNAVSRLHAAKAAEIWKDHPMAGITNGIHLATWDRFGKTVQQYDSETVISKSVNSKPVADVTDIPSYRSTDYRSTDYRSTVLPFHRSTGESKNLPEILSVHQYNKRLLLNKIQQTAGHDWPQDCLLLGWARRFVGYKRPLALFFDPAWLTAICSRPGRPAMPAVRQVRIVISGNVQPGDPEGEKLLAELKNLLAAPHDVLPNSPNPPNSQTDLSQIAAYLPSYDMELAQLLTAGCDVWLNTPVVGFEACGTSGMKACLNGVLPISTKDGWMAEIDPIGIGWIIDSDRVSDSLYKTLEHQVIPLYFDHPQEWLKNMISARQLILENFTTARVLREYVEKLYLPIFS